MSNLKQKGENGQPLPLPYACVRILCVENLKMCWALTITIKLEFQFEFYNRIRYPRSYFSCAIVYFFSKSLRYETLQWYTVVDKCRYMLYFFLSKNEFYSLPYKCEMCVIFSFWFWDYWFDQYFSPTCRVDKTVVDILIRRLKSQCPPSKWWLKLAKKNEVYSLTCNCPNILILSKFSKIPYTMRSFQLRTSAQFFGGLVTLASSLYKELLLLLSW